MGAHDPHSGRLMRGCNESKGAHEQVGGSCGGQPQRTHAISRVWHVTARLPGVDLSPDTIVGLGSAALAIVSAIVSGASASRANRQAAELERQRRKETATEAAQRILNQYRDPLLDAAQTLQGRAYNIVEDNFFGRYLHCGDPVEESHARDYTVYAIAEYLCWAEIVRRELRFLDDDVNAANPYLLTYLANIQLTLQTDRIPLPFRVFRGPQRAIAELMMVPTNAPEGPRSEAMGYAA